MPRPALTTILIVDDDTLVRNAAAAVLKKLGYRTIAAKDGEEALGIFAEQAAQIDLVMLDLRMPGMQGAEVFHRLLGIDPNARIVIATGTPEAIDASPELRDYAAGFAYKPYGLSDLASVVKKALESKSP
ncbi:MAG: Sporulation initiation phosphotransferase F [candidate division BRC1 bacterium ADurb.BinA364]|nr:MAG: Sporulation initiation phosphotransferase F [candidate division BRC1 bacterium ADurb.BinA364]